LRRQLQFYLGGSVCILFSIALHFMGREKTSIEVTQSCISRGWRIDPTILFTKTVPCLWNMIFVAWDRWRASLSIAEPTIITSVSFHLHGNTCEFYRTELSPNNCNCSSLPQTIA
jgi:hypothetical protein